jgi:hypothetical protein
MINNKFIVRNFLFLFLFLFIGRFLYPLGDEPDFFLKSLKVIKNVDYYNPVLNRHTDVYLYVRFLLDGLSESVACNIKSSPTSFFAKIDYKTCTDSLNNNLTRFLLSSCFLLLIIMPFFLDKSYNLLKKIGLNCSFHEWNLRRNILSLSLIFPSIIYYLGILSNEQVTLMLALLLFLFRGTTHLSAVLIFMILLIDTGTGLMVLIYYIFISIILYFYRYFYYWLYFFALSFLIVLFFRENLINFISYYITYIGTVFYNANEWMKADGIIEKYPIILRPLITYLSFIFLSPAKIKIIPLYIIFSFYLLLFFFKTFKRIFAEKKITSKNKSYYQNILIFISSIYFIISIVVVLPSYALAKYYIFITPFFLYGIISIYKLDKVHKFFLFSNILVFLNLLIYYI